MAGRLNLYLVHIHRPDAASFARETLHSDIEQHRAATALDAVTFFDRGVLDALYMLDLESALSRDEIARLVQSFPWLPGD